MDISLRTLRRGTIS